MADSTFTGSHWQLGATTTTVTWSFATLPGYLVDFAYTISDAFQPIVRKAFATWESLANIDFVEVADSYASNIRLGMSAIDGKEGTLAVAHWLYNGSITTKAEVQFDLAESWQTDKQSATSENFLSVAIHEIGHTLGLDHVNDPSSIMYPYATDLATPSFTDVARLQTLYGAPKGTATTAPNLADVFRFYDTKTGVHFYTASAVERDSILANLPAFTYEGSAFKTPQVGSDAHAVYRFLNMSDGTHFYTASEAERSIVQKTLGDYKFEGTAFSAYIDAGTNGQHHAVYRFLETHTGTHFYTSSDVERAAVESSLPSYKYEGIAYYVD